MQIGDINNSMDSDNVDNDEMQARKAKEKAEMEEMLRNLDDDEMKKFE